MKLDVALKVLPEAFARDPERPARFERETEVLASLNHPNFAPIYGVVEERAGDGAGRRVFIQTIMSMDPM